MVILQKRKSKLKRKFFRRSHLNIFKRRSWKSYKIQSSRRRRLHISTFRKKLLLLRIYNLSIPKYSSFVLLNRRVDSIRIQKYFFKYSRWKKKRVWRRKYRRGFKRFYLKFLSTKKLGYSKIGYYKILNNFYRRKGFYHFLKDFVKYSRLKTILKRYNRVFRPKQKKIIRKVSMGRVDKLLFLNTFFQSTISLGKKKLSFKIFFNLFLLLKFKWKKLFINKYLESLEKIRPLINYKVMFIGGKKYKIPVLMPLSKSYAVSVRWLINNMHSGNTIDSLFNCINSSLKSEGSLIKYRKEYHAISFENKSYVRFLRFLKTGF